MTSTVERTIEIAPAYGGNAIAFLAKAYGRFVAWRRFCWSVREMEKLDDRALEDIGLNRMTIRYAARHESRLQRIAGRR